VVKRGEWARWVLVLGIVGSALWLSLASSSIWAADRRIDFWSEQRRGTNCFNGNVTLAWWRAAREAGIDVVRLAPNKWISRERDFLVGNTDHFAGVVAVDLAALLGVLDDADSVGMKVVVTTLSLPGSRWRQQNGDRSDLALWRDTAYWDEAARFWRELAGHLKAHPAVVGYNIINEPTPELALGTDGAAVLNRFYQVVMAAIREEDSETPIILDGGQWASPSGLAALAPLPDEKVLYSFHMYEPFEFTNRKANSGRYCYPGQVVQDARDTLILDTDALVAILAPVAAWQKRYAVPSNRIFAGEFGCHRVTCGAADYLGDLIRLFDQHNWHWAFYAFREDTWDGMDYELGTKPPGWKYWQAIDRGEKPSLPRVDNPIWRVIRQHLKN